MTKSEVAKVLAKAAAFDSRTIGEADVEAWFECIGNMGFTEALNGVTAHYRVSNRRLMPADLFDDKPTEKFIR
jgi:hypothetical protein